MGVTHRGRRQKQQRDTREVKTKGPAEVRESSSLGERKASWERQHLGYT